MIKIVYFYRVFFRTGFPRDAPAPEDQANFLNEEENVVDVHEDRGESYNPNISPGGFLDISTAEKVKARKEALILIG
ncbi:hypothetical protein X975_09455, partial [Stegodyphus mimosarum]